MGQVIVAIGGRNYPLACRDGEEPHLTALAADIAAKAGRLTETIGVMSETRLLLMAALMIADEAHEARKAGAPAVAAAASPATDPGLIAAVARAEALAARLSA